MATVTMMAMMAMVVMPMVVMSVRYDSMRVVSSGGDGHRRARQRCHTQQSNNRRTNATHRSLPEHPSPSIHQSGPVSDPNATD